MNDDGIEEKQREESGEKKKATDRANWTRGK